MITRKLDLDIAPYIPVGISKEKIVFFDIETTGFAADVSTMYLLGAVLYEDDKWVLYQWFADDRRSEEKIINSFFDRLSADTTLVSFNGVAFDVNFIEKRCSRYGITSPLSNLSHLDLYKLIRPYKDLFRLENLKQKTIEVFMGINRDDKYSGGDLIKVYGSYLMAKVAGKPECSSMYDLLILHNEDDLKGLVKLSKLIELLENISEPFVVGGAKLDYENNVLSVTFPICINIDKRFKAEKDGISLVVSGNKCKLTVPLYHDELKFFYPNYKDYYYVPSEDIAIHKSVSFYVDKEYRTKAKAANCYSKHTGSFVPEFDEIISPYFKIDYHDTVLYVETTSEFLYNTEQISAYTRHIIDHLLH
ncbi:MAG: ribonuclease H-like domain-containing protein [Lachnospiraceae bacterium]|nr:ribonuclease H-like domain-containing protein [Lachnospiraceae bacterium]